MSINFKYKPDGKTIKDFMKSDDFFRGLRGPVGSGKSVSCCIEIFRRSLLQQKNPQGVRKSRWAVIRNTNPQLRTTTIKTWLDWFPENTWGKFHWSVPYTHHIQKGDLDIEVLFLALDRPEDVKKLLSLELTGIWINEAREVPKSIIDACTMRVGRYPSMREGGPSWSGVIADTNAPEEDHWWAIMAGEVPIPDHIPKEQAKMLIKPDNWTFYIQPPAMNETLDDKGDIKEYKNKFPLIDSHVGDWNIFPHYQFMKYEPNKYYERIHCENDGVPRNFSRIFGWMVYLNDIKDGGGTHFVHQNFTTKPVAGNLYIWPAGWTHMHHGVNAPKEVKYILTGWVNYIDN